jgi:hypothetical protein
MTTHRHSIHTTESTSENLDRILYVAEVILAANKKHLKHTGLVRRAVAFYRNYLDRLIDEAGVRGVPPELIQDTNTTKGVTEEQLQVIYALRNERVELQKHREKKKWVDPVKAAQPWREDKRPFMEQIREDMQRMEKESNDELPND